MKIGLVQYNPEWEDPSKNIIKIDRLLSEVNTKTDLLIFPEMTLTGFTMHAEKFAEEIDGISTRYFIQLAQKTKQHVFAGTIERSNSKFYNTLYHFDNNGIITAKYRKIHPFSYAKENIFYTAGSEVVITKIEQTKIGLSICYDLRFPELYRYYGKQKVEVIIVIANWPITRIEHWEILLKARAIENQCFVVGVNRVGNDPYYKYNGCSSVFDPLGNSILEAGEEEKIFTVDVDLKKVSEIRESLPFLNDVKLI
ncbi:carbon-nitrogen family hydrolase [Melioribacteraceae bacterium 4301-Me]|uniref:carbon-nitrogen family hydrolase n=1 Tax=Pyranulibacter aquaticus TaxID=3163344 RepID=UPI0035950168